MAYSPHHFSVDPISSRGHQPLERVAQYYHLADISPGAGVNGYAGVRPRQTLDHPPCGAERYRCHRLRDDTYLQRHGEDTGGSPRGARENCR